MQDPRFFELAKQLVHYSTSIKKDEKVLLHLVDIPDEMGIALIREVRAKKAIPFVKIEHGKISREMLNGSTDDQYKLMAKHQLSEMKDMDAYIAEHGILVNPLVAEGYPSIGCAPCGRDPNP